MNDAHNTQLGLDEHAWDRLERECPAIAAGIQRDVDAGVSAEQIKMLLERELGSHEAELMQVCYRAARWRVRVRDGADRSAAHINILKRRNWQPA